MAKNDIRFYAIPNGGKRDIREAIKFKRCGVQCGIPDLCIPFPSKSYHGLYIELKRKVKSKVSESQQEWIDYLNKKGYFSAICYGFEEAQKTIMWYLEFLPDCA